ncbi:MAG: branched-chain amino acid ABC transporter permease [Acidimicrobiales bacterium]
MALGRKFPGFARLPRQPLLRHLLVALLGGIVLYFYSSSVGQFSDFQLAEIGAYAIVLVGLTVLIGLNGQVSLGHGAFMAIGGYSAALVLKHQQFPLVVVFLIAIGVSAFVGGIFGIAAARLRGPYLAGITLSLAIALPEVFVHFESVFKGEQGIIVNPLAPPAWAGPTFTPERWLAWISLFAALIIMVLVANLMRGRFGRAFRAVRDDEIAASVAGIHVAKTQILAFVVSAACAGLGGSLLALGNGLVSPAGYSLLLSLSLLTGVVVGGLGSIVGAIWGAIILVYLNQWVTDAAKSLHFSPTAGANMSNAAYGVLLILVMILFPEGIQGGLRRLGHIVKGDGPQAAKQPKPARLLDALTGRSSISKQPQGVIDP